MVVVYVVGVGYCGQRVGAEVDRSGGGVVGGCEKE